MKKMKKKRDSQHGILLRIGRSFAAHRRRQGDTRRVRYPDRLKRLAASALAAGARPSWVARASGVSQKSIDEWRKEFISDERPHELQLVARREGLELDLPSATARLQFRSGVWMELPVSALGRDFLVALNGDGER